MKAKFIIITGSILIMASFLYMLGKFFFGQPIQSMWFLWGMVVGGLLLGYGMKYKGSKKQHILIPCVMLISTIVCVIIIFAMWKILL